MTEGWRVCLSSFDDRSGARKNSLYYRAVVRDLLRTRFGDDIAVSSEKMRIFLYAGTADAAEEAEHVARDALAQRNLSADIRLERWDPSAGAWQDARAEAPDRAAPGLPTAPQGKPRRRRLRSAAGALIETVVEAVIDNIVP